MTLSNEFTYRAKVKKHNGWQKFKTARFGISVGKPYHEGNKLRAALEWAIPRFDSIEIRVSDTLQRYNFSGMSGENYQSALRAGDEWIKRNLHILKTVPNLKLFRWDSLLNDPEYPKYYNEIMQRLKEPKVQEAFKLDAQDYASRSGKDANIQFLREEFAIFTMLHDRRPAAEIYPGGAMHTPQVLRPDYNQTAIGFARIPVPEDMRLAA